MAHLNIIGPRTFAEIELLTFDEIENWPFSQATIEHSYSTEIQSLKRNQASYSTEIQSLNYAAPAISDPTNPTNSFFPSIYIDGSTYSEHVATAIPSPPAKGVYINADWGAGICDIIGYQVSLGLNGGGQFSMLTQTPVAAIGSVVTLFGITGVITYSACVSGRSAKGYKTEGIFGNSRELNKQMLLVLQAPQLKHLNSLFRQDIFLQNAPSTQWRSVADCALAIASYAQIGLSWQAPDVPLTDAFLETGITVGDALRSLAGRVGALFLWNGNTNYVVTTPDTGYGGWATVPCELVNAGGIEVGTILDLTGPILYFPVNPVQNGNAIFNRRDPILFPPAAPIISKGSFTQVPTLNAAPRYIDLDGDTKLTDGVIPIVNSENGLRYQIVRGINQPDTGDPGIVPKILDTVPSSPTFGQLVDDVSHWVPLGTPIVKGLDGKYKAEITNATFPGGLLNNQFSYNIGYLRDTTGLNTAAQDAFNENVQRKKLLMQAQQERIRYFRAQSGSLNFRFFGSLPMPGNRVTINYDDCNMAGIVESVSASYPDKNCTMTVGRYIRIEVPTARSTLDVFLALGP